MDWYRDQKPVRVYLTKEEVCALLDVLDRHVLREKQDDGPLLSVYIKIRGREPRYFF